MILNLLNKMIRYLDDVYDPTPNSEKINNIGKFLSKMELVLEHNGLCMIGLGITNYMDKRFYAFLKLMCQPDFKISKEEFMVIIDDWNNASETYYLSGSGYYRIDKKSINKILNFQMDTLDIKEIKEKLSLNL